MDSWTEGDNKSWNRHDLPLKKGKKREHEGKILPELVYQPVELEYCEHAHTLFENSPLVNIVEVRELAGVRLRGERAFLNQFLYGKSPLYGVEMSNSNCNVFREELFPFYRLEIDSRPPDHQI